MLLLEYANMLSNNDKISVAKVLMHMCIRPEKQQTHSHLQISLLRKFYLTISLRMPIHNIGIFGRLRDARIKWPKCRKSDNKRYSIVWKLCKEGRFLLCLVALLIFRKINSDQIAWL